MRKYKSIAGSKRLSGYAVDKYTKDNFSDLTRMNVYKLNNITTDCWGAPSYQQYMEMAGCKRILDLQATKVEKERKISVLTYVRIMKQK